MWDGGSMGKLIHGLESDSNIKMMTMREKISYLCYFFTRSLLIAILTLIVAIGTGVMLYLGDLLFNVKTGNYNSPLFSAYVIVSKSMVPTINVNDAIIVTRTNYDKLNIGDVITFSSEDRVYNGLTVTHRIVGKQLLENGEIVYRTKGDNNSQEDRSVVKKENIYGKVVITIPKLGYIQNFLSKPIGFFTCIFIPILIVLIIDIRKIICLLIENSKLKEES